MRGYVEEINALPRVGDIMRKELQKALESAKLRKEMEERRQSRRVDDDDMRYARTRHSRYKKWVDEVQFHADLTEYAPEFRQLAVRHFIDEHRPEDEWEWEERWDEMFGRYSLFQSPETKADIARRRSIHESELQKYRAAKLLRERLDVEAHLDEWGADFWDLPHPMPYIDDVDDDEIGEIDFRDTPQPEQVIAPESVIPTETPPQYARRSRRNRHLFPAPARPQFQMPVITPGPAAPPQNGPRTFAQAQFMQRAQPAPAAQAPPPQQTVQSLAQTILRSRYRPPPKTHHQSRRPPDDWDDFD
jgi:hypothetical protein